MKHEFADFFQALAAVNPQAGSVATSSAASCVEVVTVDATQFIGGGENTLNLH